MLDSPRVLLWPRVVPRWHWSADWCTPRRVFEARRALAPVVDPERLRDGARDGVVFVFDTPTTTFLRHVAPVLLDEAVPFAVSVTTALVRTRTPRRARADAVSVTWNELAALAEAGVTLAVRSHDVDDVAHLPDELAFGQLATARMELRRRIGVDAWLVCDPSTASRPEVARMAREMGFEVGLVRSSSTPLARVDPLRTPALVPRPWQPIASIARRFAERARAVG